MASPGFPKHRKKPAQTQTEAVQAIVLVLMDTVLFDKLVINEQRLSPQIFNGPLRNRLTVGNILTDLYNHTHDCCNRAWHTKECQNPIPYVPFTMDRYTVCIIYYNCITVRYCANTVIEIGRIHDVVCAVGKDLAHYDT